MDLGSSNPTAVKTPEPAETETPTPTRIQPPAFTNGVLKRHAPLHHLHHGHHHPVVVSYRECLKNHAATIGGHALDGCGEFMPAPASNPADPTSLKCAACGCHRNFHRRDPDDLPPAAAPALEYHPHHRHHPPPPRGNGGGSGSSPNNSPSPPPISSSYYPSAPHMLLALSHGAAPPPENSTPAAATPAPPPILINSNSSSRKRFRTKFTQFQKEKMLEFAEKVGWKMQKREEDLINEFCTEIGVDKGVFKVWMHNNKNTFGKKDPPPHNLSNPTAAAAEISTPPPNANGISYTAVAFHQNDGGGDKERVPGQEMSQLHLRHDNSGGHALGTNGSSSSS